MLLFTLALPVVLLQDVQAQISSRLKSSAHWQSTGSAWNPIDSADYNYSNGRGGSLTNVGPLSMDMVAYYNTPGLGYDNARNWMWAYPQDSLYKASSSFQTFDSHNNILSTTWEDDMGAPTQNKLYFYDASNRLVKTIDQNWGGFSWVSHTQHLFSYNAAGQLALDSVQTWNNLTMAWDMSSLSTYFYDGAQNMISSVFDLWSGGVPNHQSRWDRTYSSTNQLLTSTYSSWTGSGWLEVFRYTHDYTSGGDPISLLEQYYNTVTAVWDNYRLYIYSNYNAAHQPQTMTMQFWNSTGAGSWDNSMQYHYTYNSFNQVENVTGISWNATSGLYQYASGDPMDNYRYELFNTTGLNNVAAAGEVNVYPVPAANTVNIDLNWKDAQAADITIVDAKGSVVKHWNVAASVRATNTINVSNFAAGVYFVKINSASQQIVKQIVVAH